MLDQGEVSAHNQGGEREENFSPVYTHLMHVQAFVLVASHALDISQHSLKE